MRGGQWRYTAALAAHILGQLRSGRSLRAVCRDDGMPTLNTVLNWVKADRDGFAARYRAVRAIVDVPRGRPTRYSAAIAGRLLEGLSAGRWLREICGDPGMPCPSTVRQWVIDDR